MCPFRLFCTIEGLEKLREKYELHKLWNLVKAKGAEKNKLTRVPRGFQKISQNITKSQNKCRKTFLKTEEFCFLIYGDS
jgi:hypothetical protein